MRQTNVIKKSQTHVTDKLNAVLITAGRFKAPDGLSDAISRHYERVFICFKVALE